MPSTTGWDSDENWIKFRVRPPSDFIRIITKKLNSGILIHIGYLPDGKSAIQSIHFPKSSFDSKSAKDWLKKMNSKKKGG